MRFLSVLLVCVVFPICAASTVQAVESNDCAPLSSLIARNFCTSIDIESLSAGDTKTLEPVPDPISVGGFTGFSCRFGLWVEKISSWLSTSMQDSLPLKKQQPQLAPQLATNHVQIIDITVDHKNVVCVPVEMDMKNTN